MGTSHRQAPVKDARRPRPRRPRASCSRCPTATRSCSATAARPRSGTPPPFGLVRERALHLTFGEFSPKFATVDQAARRSSPTRSSSRPSPGDAPDAASPTRASTSIAWAHNETSTGVMVPVARPAGAGDALVLDRRHLGRRRPAGRRRARPTSTTSRRRSASPPTAGCGSRCSARPRIERIERARARATAGSPTFLVAADRARQLAQGPDLQHARRSPRCSCSPTSSSGCSANGGLDWCVARTARLLDAPLRLGRGVATFATPFVADPAKRSLVVGTIDFDDAVDAAAVAATLRANGIVDTEPYRKLGRNQLRIGDVPGDRPGRRRRRSPPASTGSSSGCGDDAGPRRREDRRLRRRRCCASTSTSTTGDHLEPRIGDYDGDPHPLGDEARPPTLIERADEPARRSAAPASGVDNVDVPAATKRGIVVANAPQSNVVTAAEHTMALLLALARNVPQAHASLDRRPLGALAVLGRRAARQDARHPRLRPHRPARRPARPGLRHARHRLRPVRRRRALPRARASRRPSPPTTSTREADFLTAPPAQDAGDRGLARRRGAAPSARTACASLNVARGAADRRRGPRGRAGLRQGRRRGARRLPHRADHRAPALRLPQRHRHAAPRAPRPPRRTDRAGFQAAEQVVAALTGGVVSSAVNVPAVAAEDMEVLGPVPAALRASSGGWRWRSARGRASTASRSSCSGGSPSATPARSAVAVLLGVLTGHTEEDVNAVNAPADRRGARDRADRDARHPGARLHRPRARDPGQRRPARARGRHDARPPPPPAPARGLGAALQPPARGPHRAVPLPRRAGHDRARRHRASARTASTSPRRRSGTSPRTATRTSR